MVSCDAASDICQALAPGAGVGPPLEGECSASSLYGYGGGDSPFASPSAKQPPRYKSAPPTRPRGVGLPDSRVATLPPGVPGAAVFGAGSSHPVFASGGARTSRYGRMSRGMAYQFMLAKSYSSIPRQPRESTMRMMTWRVSFVWP